MNSYLVFLGFLWSLGMGYVGVKLILAARLDATRLRLHREQAARHAAEFDRYRQELREQNARALASDGLDQAIASYEALDRIRVQ